jgi:hypothetical protein
MIRSALLALVCTACSTVGHGRPGIVAPSRETAAAIERSVWTGTAFSVPVVGGGFMAAVFACLIIEHIDLSNAQDVADDTLDS